ncbi:MAG: hypothetical protein AMJ68_01135 [Acidithiobacillales bacterium SG8_45]|nr:MAG: hypothetical protein AMJ68_01135 [Acidithiobacillales bacterium SG8_45]
MIALVSLLSAGAVVSADNNQYPPMADIHLHYNAEQVGVTSPEDVIAALKRNNVTLAVMIGTPPDLALDITRESGGWIVPIFSPYLSPSYRKTWFKETDVLPAAEEALRSGKYYGIGEFHLRHVLGPRRDNPVMLGLIELGIKYDVPLLIHTEASSEKYFEPLCLKYPKARFLWAHAGGLLKPEQVGSLMANCPNVWVEFSARDPWRYIHSHIVDESGGLLPGWVALIRKYPSRFMTGSDPVWPVDTLHRWDEPDTGWQEIDRFLAFHRKWLSQLPPELESRVRLENAKAFFRNPGR